MGIIKERRKLNRAVRKSKNIFLMAHKDLDLDALGSCIGLYMILRKRKKKCYIIIDDVEHELGVNKVLVELDGCLNIIKSENVDKYLSPREKKNLLIILDTNKKDLVQNPDVLKKFENNKDCVSIIDNKVSSTCEMITSLIEYYDVEIDSYYATILLSGIVLDTNNYTLNTTAETHYSSYYLISLGASAKKVQYLLKQDLEEYTERQKLLTSIETLKGKVAFTKGTSGAIYRREDLARIADTLLFFNNIEASFVIGKVGKNIVGLSARSLGNYDISKILEKLGGGGDAYNGAARFEDVTLKQVEAGVKKLIEEGE